MIKQKDNPPDRYNIGGNMQIQFIYDASAASAPAGFSAALTYVAEVLDALITNPITVNINVGWNEIGGVTLESGVVAEGGPLGGVDMSYADLVAVLTVQASNPAAMQELASLPATAPPLIGSYYIAPAQEKAWGMLPPSATPADGEIGFSSAYSYSFDPNDQSAAGLFEFIGVAEHEIAHALGRIYSDGPLELVDYAAPGVLAAANTGGYFSLDGGQTNLGQFSPVGDTADWAPPSNGDSFEYLAYPGMDGIMTPVDKTLMGVLGFNVNPAAAPANPVIVPIQSPYSSGTRHWPAHFGGAAEGGPETVQAGANGATPVRHAFIHNRDDAIHVDPVGRPMGGPQTDIFHTADRASTTGKWSILADAHAGNAAANWGVTPDDFTIGRFSASVPQGTPGVTRDFVQRQHEVKEDLPGSITADLSNARLPLLFGPSSSGHGWS
jgi:hypothetical protein